MVEAPLAPAWDAAGHVFADTYLLGDRRREPMRSDTAIASRRKHQLAWTPVRVRG